MAVDRYCIEPGCPGGDGCKNEYRTAGRPCVFEYVAEGMPEAYKWKGEGPPPRRWTATDGTVVYRSFADYVD